MRHVRLLLAVTLVGLVTSGSVAAGAGADAVEIHGYGGWAYGRNDAEGVTYLASSHEGEADYVNLALAFVSHASDRVYINAQVWWEAEPGEEEKALVDYAFGEWRFSDALRLRMGQVKHPYGIYTEVFDVGTIRPFFWLAQSVYGPTGTVAESYHGLGLTGSGFADSGLEFEYDLYAGEMCVEVTDLSALLSVVEGGDPVTEGEAEAGLRDLGGGA